MEKKNYTIRDAFVEAVNQEADRLPLTDPFPASEKHQKKMSSLFKEKGNFADRFVRALPRVALAAVTLCLFTAGLMWIMSMSSIEMAGFTVDGNDGGSSISISTDKKDSIEDSLYKSYNIASLPDGFELAQEIVHSDTAAETTWTNENGSKITLTQSAGKDQTWKLSAKTIYEEITVGDNEAIYYEEENSQSIMWIEDGYVFKITAENLTVEDLSALTDLTDWNTIAYSEEVLTGNNYKKAYSELRDIIDPILKHYENGILLRKVEIDDGRAKEHCIVIKLVNKAIRVFDFDRGADMAFDYWYNAPIYSYFVLFDMGCYAGDYTQIRLNDGEKGYEKYLELSLKMDEITQLKTTIQQCFDILPHIQDNTAYFLDGSIPETPDITINGVPYYESRIDSFKDYATFKAHLTAIMTEKFAAANLAYSAKNINGKLYFRAIDRYQPTHTAIGFGVRFVEKKGDTLRFSLSFCQDGCEYSYIVLKRTDDGYRVAYFSLDNNDSLMESKYKFSEEYLSYNADDLNEKERVESRIIPKIREEMYD